MEQIKFGEYLLNPMQIQTALDMLDEKCNQMSFEDLFRRFEKALKIGNEDGFPITVVTIGGMTCRARINDAQFVMAESVEQIGAKKTGILQGRANAPGYCIFYGANCKKTAALEVLQSKPPGHYVVTIGCWESEIGLNIANLVDGADPDFSKIPFVHSLPSEYIKGWPELPRQSAILIMNYFKDKFKMPYTEGLYNITNIISGICFSLKDVDGIGYGATSDHFEGFNIALKDPSKVKCVEVERWLIEKLDSNNCRHKKIQTGLIQDDGGIKW